jgi:hypothetical protein
VPDWPSLPYEEWKESLDTLHAHSQVLGKLAVALAPPEWQFQHVALRLTARGWETLPLRAPDGSGAFVAALDLHSHHVVVEHSDGRAMRIPLVPNRSVGDVTQEVLAALETLVGPVTINTHPQEVSWEVPLDEDTEHHTYEPEQVERYFSVATRAALVLAEVRAPYRGRSSPVNAWWGSFDLAVNLYSGAPADPPSADFIVRNSDNAQLIAVGWWPGDARHPRAAFYGYAFPSPDGFSLGRLSPLAAHWDDGLGEFVLEWDDVVASRDPHSTAVEFCRSLIAHSCGLLGWDPQLAASAQGKPFPVS